VRKQLFGFTLSEQADSITYFRWLDFAALVMFAAAVWVSKTRHPRKNTFYWVILLTSMGLFGFYSNRCPGRFWSLHPSTWRNMASPKS